MKLRSFLIVIIWILLSLAISVNQVIQPMAIIQISSNVEQSGEDNPVDSGEATFVLQSNLALSSFSQVTLHQEFYQIR